MQIRTKAEWRAYSIRRRDDLSTEERKARSELICGRLIRSAWISAIQERNPQPTVLVYWPFRSEVDIRPFVAWAWKQSWNVAAPRVDRSRSVMSFYLIYAPSDLRPGAYGIMEPNHAQPLLSNEATADLIIVPGAAFDRQGNRIGYGGGYYDRAFAHMLHAGKQADKLPLRVAPAFDLQVFERLPVEQHDMSVQKIVTENEEWDTCR